MSNKKILTKDDILHLAKLSKLKLTEDEINKYLSQLSNIVNYFNKLNEIDTTDVEPVAHITGLANVSSEDNKENKRGLSQNDALRNAKSKKDGYIKVKAIFTR